MSRGQPLDHAHGPHLPGIVGCGPNSEVSRLTRVYCLSIPRDAEESVRQDRNSMTEGISCSYRRCPGSVSLPRMEAAFGLAGRPRYEPHNRRLSKCASLCAALWLSLAVLPAPAVAQ